MCVAGDQRHAIGERLPHTYASRPCTRTCEVRSTLVYSTVLPPDKHNLCEFFKLKLWWAQY